ncbi:MAG: serine/threonine-protein phosphatase, partial [Silvibacterium sp.]|nr:serine/threonine-protein phosphatase [Silvibacterium sp.]
VLYYRSIPLRQMRWLFLAVFCLFAIMGLFNDLMDLGKQPYPIVIINAVASGLVAMVYVLIATRYRYYWFVIVSLLQFPFWIGFAILVNFLYRHHHLREVPSDQGIRVMGVAILVLVVMSYSLFIGFISRQGAEAYRIRNELELAHGIQKTLVPPITLRTANFEVYGISKPSEKVGGDLVDALALEDGDAIAYMADIAGHGLQAGILMGMLKTAARTALLEAAELKRESTLPLLLERLNSVLPGVKEPHMYATFTGFRLGADGSVHYALAASPPLLHWHANGAEVAHLEEEQFPLGLLPVSGFDGRCLETFPGDLLVVATDGILEVCDKGEEEFGTGRLKAVIAANARAPLGEIAEQILGAATAFGNQPDDQTILIVRRL